METGIPEAQSSPGPDLGITCEAPYTNLQDAMLLVMRHEVGCIPW
jgi:hypothetical protein